MWRSSFSKNKTVLKKSQHMREGKSLFENKSQIELVIMFNSNYFPWERKTLTRVAGIDRGRNHWAMFVSYNFHEFLRLHISQTKKCLNSRNGHHRGSVEKAVLKNFALFTGKHLSLFLIEWQPWRPVILLKETSNKTSVFMWILPNF